MKGLNVSMHKIGDKITVFFQGEKKEAEIVSMEKIFRETDTNGDFVEQGLFLLENAIPTIPLPYEYHEDVIVVHYPESKLNNDRNDVVYRCRDHAYTLQIDENLLVVSEEELTKYSS